MAKRARPKPDAASSDHIASPRGSSCSQKYDIFQDKDVKMGDGSSLETHPGTKQWARRVMTYGSQYGDEWSEELSYRLAKELTGRGARFFIFKPKSRTQSEKKWHSAIDEEIHEQCNLLFHTGGGKKQKQRSSRKKGMQHDLFFPGKHKESPGSTPTHDTNPRYKIGDTAFAFESLYPVRILDVLQAGDNVAESVKIHWQRYSHVYDGWIPAWQIMSDSMETREFSKRCSLPEENDEEDKEDTTRETLLTMMSSKRRRRDYPSKMMSSKPQRPSDASTMLSEDHLPVDETTPRKQEDVVGLTDIIQAATESCHQVVNQAKDPTANWDSIQKGSYAKWATAVIDQIGALPSVDSLRDQCDKLRGEGMDKRFELSITEEKLAKMESLQHHIAAFVEGLAKDL